MYFPVAGIEASPLLPPLAAFAVSLLTGMGGVSGAFLLLPFQVSVLGYANPSVSATNQFFNVVATPGGVLRYWREGRLLAPLALVTMLGCLPGVAVGAVIRLNWLADPARFKLFAALVLLFLAWRLGRDLRRPDASAPSGAPGDARPQLLPRGKADRRVRFRFQDVEYAYDPAAVLGLTAVIGVIGGTYGIGGGSILAPFLVSLFGLPVHVTAGPTLLCTLTTSAGGVLIYVLLAPLYPGLNVAPDWTLGLLLGLGGLAGTYLAARLQKRLPARPIKALLALVVLGTAAAWLAPLL